MDEKDAGAIRLKVVVVSMVAFLALKSRRKVLEPAARRRLRRTARFQAVLVCCEIKLVFHDFGLDFD